MSIRFFNRAMCFILGMAFIKVGIEHFIDPLKFDLIVPKYLICPRFWTLFSGFIEIALGIGLFFEKTYKKSSLLLVIFLVLVYLANLNMWVNDIPFNGSTFGILGHVVRLFIQLILISFFIWVFKCQK